MRVTRHAYAADGWGAGELWVAGDVVVHHEIEIAGDADSSPADLADFGPASPADLGPAAFAYPGPAPPIGGTRPPEVSVRDGVKPDCDDFAASLCRRFERHLAGEPTAYGDVTIELDWATPFQAQLVAALRSVPWGEVVSYGELAALAGRPRAARAAGTMCAGNRFALIVPCHRVVASDGIGGYGRSGVGLKRRLLALEGVEM